METIVTVVEIFKYRYKKDGFIYSFVPGKYKINIFNM